MTETPQPETQDLTKINPSPSTVPAPVRSPQEVPYDPAPDRENVRAAIALLLPITLVIVILVAAGAGVATVIHCYAKDAACTAETVELKSIRSVIEVVLTPLIGLVGAVTGFYFGEKSGTAKPGG